MVKRGVGGWSRAHRSAAALAPACEWRSELARCVREAADVTFASVLTCPPGQWYTVEHDTYPYEYGPLIEAVRREFLARIDAVGEGWRFAVDRFGPVYAPIDSAHDRVLAEELRARLLAPADIDGYVSTFLLDEHERLIGLVVLGSERPSRALLDTTEEPLRSVGRQASSTLSVALDLARACGAAVPEPSPADLGALTPRERQIAALAAEGLSGVNIAARLAIAEATVAVHLRRIHQKLRVHSRVELARKMLGVG